MPSAWIITAHFRPLRLVFRIKNVDTSKDIKRGKETQRIASCTHAQILATEKKSTLKGFTHHMIGSQRIDVD